MIGVICREDQRETAEEFFELFKTPWEMFGPGRDYDVLVVTDPDFHASSARLVVASSADRMRVDTEKGIAIRSFENQGWIRWKSDTVPVYGKLAVFDGSGRPFLSTAGGDCAGIEMGLAGGKLLRLGYDIFEEVRRLLHEGQPAENALVPSLGIHISALREWILEAGIPLAEILPSPHGFDFITCLTHDIDFMGIRNHRFDHSMLGFAYRCLFPKYMKKLGWKTAFPRYGKNLRALLSLPLVQAGLLPDFWYPLDRYPEVEGGRKSTFFFIPFKDRSGTSPAGRLEKYRAARYDLACHAEPILGLKRQGREIGLHGIDAWKSAHQGGEEFAAIRRITGDERIGVRMHWLYFSGETPRILEESGALYDSSLGYNDAVGYRSGTTQPFRLPGTKDLYELPMHAQDTAMFYPDRMGVSENEGIELLARLLKDFRTYGGAFTINWHDRSLAPERNWDAVYSELLKMLSDSNTWFATAGEAVGWFRKRRAFRFDGSDSADGVPGGTRSYSGPAGPDGPPLTLRVHRPASPSGVGDSFRDYCMDDYPNFSGPASFEVSI